MREQYQSEHPPLVVAKFGGTSVASPLHVVERLLEYDNEPRIVVVSAVGGSTPNEKLTNMLEEYQLNPSMALYRRIVDRRVRHAQHLLHNQELAWNLAMTTDEDIDTYLHRGWSVSALGEKWSAEALVHKTNEGILPLERRELLNPVDVIAFNRSGELELTETMSRIAQAALADHYYVLPGFYGADNEGNVTTFPRGGSDITGALAAMAIGADEYHNFTDVDGVYENDPRVDPSARMMMRARYGELAQKGCAVFHHDACRHLDGSGVTTVIRNTFVPNQFGTVITTDSLASSA